MSFCKYCGEQVEQDAVVCIHCGRSLKETKTYSADDTGSIGWGVLGFFIPIVGLILYLVWKETKPKSASVAGKGALIGFIVNIILSVCYAVVIIPRLAESGYYVFRKLFLNLF